MKPPPSDRANRDSPIKSGLTPGTRHFNVMAGKRSHPTKQLPQKRSKPQPQQASCNAKVSKSGFLGREVVCRTAKATAREQHRRNVQASPRNRHGKPRRPQPASTALPRCSRQRHRSPLEGPLCSSLAFKRSDPERGRTKAGGGEG